MNLNEVTNPTKHYYAIKKCLLETYDINMSFFERLPVGQVEALAQNVDAVRSHFVAEGVTPAHHMTPIFLLNEALRVYLREIYPQKKVKFKIDESHDTNIDLDNGINDSDEQSDLQSSGQYEIEKKLVKQLQNPYANLDAFIKHDDDVKPNDQNIYVPVLTSANSSDGEVIKLTIPGGDDHESPVAASINSYGKLSNILNNPVIENLSKGNLKEGEMSKIEKMTKLTESVMLEEAELQRAEIVLATKDIVSRLQKQIEDISSMATDDVLPLVDGMKENFGNPTANGFAKKAEDALQKASDGVQELRDLFDSYARALEKHIADGGAPNDLSLGDEVPAPVAPEADPALELGDDYEKKDPTDALVGESIEIAGKRIQISEAEAEAFAFAKKYRENPFPRNMLHESEKKMLKLASTLIKAHSK